MEPEPSSAPAGASESERSLAEDLRDLIDHGRVAVEAEVAFQKSRATYAAASIGKIAALGAVAAAIAFVSVIALSVGLIFSLAPLLTPLGATAAVVGAMLLVAGILALLAVARWKRMIATISDNAAADGTTADGDKPA